MFDIFIVSISEVQHEKYDIQNYNIHNHIHNV